MPTFYVHQVFQYESEPTAVEAATAEDIDLTAFEAIGDEFVGVRVYDSDTAEDPVLSTVDGE